jgi:hypothetical protein
MIKLRRPTDETTVDIGSLRAARGSLRHKFFLQLSRDWRWLCRAIWRQDRAHNPGEVGSEFWSARSERLRISLDAADVPPLGGIVRRLVGFCALNAVAGRSEHDDEEELSRWVTAASCLVALDSAAQARSIYDLRSMLALRVAVPTCASAQEYRATVDCSRQ